MTEELVYTSAPQGLHPNSSGFCTVEMTEGMLPETMDSLESLSAYDNDPSGTVNWLHVRMQTVRGARHVLSRIGPLQGEFSGRTNKLAHHLCLSLSELTPQGPMQILGRGGPLRQQWSGEVGRLPQRPRPTKLRAASGTRVCRSWASAAGDAGIAGAVLSRLRRSNASTVWLIRAPQMDALAMTDEMLSLLPGQDRWEITFCTYLHNLPHSVECRLRWVLPGSPAMQRLRDLGPDQLIDLRSGTDALLRDADAGIVDAARKGKAIVDRLKSPSVARVSSQKAGVPRQPAVKRGLDQAVPGLGEPSQRAPLPAPPKQSASPVRWVMIGAAIGLLPAGALMFFVMSSDPAPVAAMREFKTENRTESPAEGPVQTPPSITPKSKPRVADESRDRKPKTDKKPRPTRDQGKPAAKAKKPEKPKPAIQQTTQVSLKLPTLALSAGPLMQLIHQGAGVYETALNNVAPMIHPYDFELSDADNSGVRDLNFLASPTGERGRIGSIHTEPDRVLLAWSPTAKRDVASSFLLAHEFVIKDETHQTTVQLDLADPIEVLALRVPRKATDIAIPDWIVPEFECRVKPTFFSSVSDKGIHFDAFAVTPHVQNVEPAVHRRKQDISALKDRMIRHAEILLAGAIIGSGTSRKIRLFSELELGGSGKKFSWSIRENKIREQVTKHNKKAANKDKTNALERMKKIDNWGSSLRCEIELYARVNGRDVLWGKSKGDAE